MEATWWDPTSSLIYSYVVPAKNVVLFVTTEMNIYTPETGKIGLGQEGTSRFYMQQSFVPKKFHC